MLDLSSLFVGSRIPTKEQQQQKLSQGIEAAPSAETVLMEVDSEASFQLLSTDTNNDSSTSQQASQPHDQSSSEITETQQIPTHAKVCLSLICGSQAFVLV